MAASARQPGLFEGRARGLQIIDCIEYLQPNGLLLLARHERVHLLSDLGIGEVRRTRVVAHRQAHGDAHLIHREAEAEHLAERVAQSAGKFGGDVLRAGAASAAVISAVMHPRAVARHGQTVGRAFAK